MDRLTNMESFKEVALQGSFAGAARKLGVATSVVSKRISDLEAFLNVRLLHRTTRKVSLTSAGYDYLDRIGGMLDGIAEVEESMRNRTEKPFGAIKLAAPMSFGQKVLSPLLASFMVKWPDVTIDLSLSDRHVNIIEEGYDLTVRIAELTDSSLISRKLMPCPVVICAAPCWLDEFGRPEKPDDLIDRDCLIYTGANSRGWPLLIDGKVKWMKVAGRFSSDNGDMLAEMAINSGGLVHLPRFIVEDAVSDGRLEVVLPDYCTSSINAWALYPERRHQPARVRLLIEHLANELGAI